MRSLIAAAAGATLLLAGAPTGIAVADSGSGGGTEPVEGVSVTLESTTPEDIPGDGWFDYAVLGDQVYRIAVVWPEGTDVPAELPIVVGEKGGEVAAVADVSIGCDAQEDGTTFCVGAVSGRLLAGADESIVRLNPNGTLTYECDECAPNIAVGTTFEGHDYTIDQRPFALRAAIREIELTADNTKVADQTVVDPGSQLQLKVSGINTSSTVTIGGTPEGMFRAGTHTPNALGVLTLEGAVPTEVDSDTATVVIEGTVDTLGNNFPPHPVTFAVEQPDSNSDEPEADQDGDSDEDLDASVAPIDLADVVAALAGEGGFACPAGREVDGVSITCRDGLELHGGAGEQIELAAGVRFVTSAALSNGGDIADAELWMFSTPSQLATFFPGSNGEAIFQAVVPDEVAEGTHTVAAVLTSGDEAEVVYAQVDVPGDSTDGDADVDVDVDADLADTEAAAAAGESGKLANTGASVAVAVLLLALAAAGIGGGMWLRRRDAAGSVVS